MRNLQNLIAATIFIFTTVNVFAVQSGPLFVIRRSKNANEVHFDASIGADGKIDPERPVTAYWMMLAEKGQREEIKTFEKLAYGFKCNYDKQGQYRLIIRVFKQREILLREDDDDGGVSAELAINGKPAFLDEIYIDETEKVPFPLVHYIELSGKDKTTGGKVREKIIVHKLPKILDE